MKINEAINWLEYKPRHKDKTDLTKIKKALMLLGNPENNFKSIHITGTNGKGSTAHTISAVLSNNFKTGLFTSPYVTRFNERLQINDAEIADEVLLKYILWAKEFDQQFFKENNDNFSFFELLTLIMIKYFSDEKVEYAVIEVGIGGRLDSTNVITADYAVITSIGLDHTKQLGNTLEEILTEKLGILKNNKKLFMAVEGFDDLVLTFAKEKNATVSFVKSEDYEIINNLPLTFKYEEETFSPSLQGLYQIKNTILAILVLKEIVKDLKIIKEKIGLTKNPGRFEILSYNPLIILDGAHNYEAIDKLCLSLKEMFQDKKIKVLYASMDDKPYLKMITRLKELTSEIYLTSLDYPRALKDFSNDIFNGLKVFNEPLKVFKKLKSTLTKEDCLVVTGSIYLVGVIRNEYFKN